MRVMVRRGQVNASHLNIHVTLGHPLGRESEIAYFDTSGVDRLTGFREVAGPEALAVGGGYSLASGHEHLLAALDWAPPSAATVPPST